MMRRWRRHHAKKRAPAVWQFHVRHGYAKLPTIAVAASHESSRAKLRAAQFR